MMLPVEEIAVRFFIWLIEIKVKEYGFYSLFNILSICLNFNPIKHKKQ